jgi:hypothetical protein
VALGRDGLHRSRERLTEDLTAEHGAPAEVLALAAEEVLLDSLEGEEIDELVEDVLRHGRRRGESGMYFMKSSSGVPILPRFLRIFSDGCRKRAMKASGFVLCGLR